ncbi:MAG: prepilin peptidase [archaeon]|jgi:preflagellin peptidase FlaK
MVINYFLISIIVSLVGLIIATYTDLKERIVPNKLNYGLALLGLIIFGTQSYLESTPNPIIYSFFGMCFGFFFGWIMWKLGVFAGGDVKLFMGLGALNPFTPALLKMGILTNASLPLFPVTLFLYSLISFLPYGLFVIITRVSKNKKFQKELFLQMKPKVITAIHASFFASAIYTILFALNTNALLTIVAIFIWEATGKYKNYITTLAIIFALILNLTLFVQALIAALIISVGLYTSIKLMLSARKVLSSEVLVKSLEEGMIPSKSLIWKGKKIIEEQSIDLGFIIKCIKEKNSQPLLELLKPKKEIISARKARGLTEDELREVKKLAAKGLIPKKILIKESMPFVPTMLLGYILCLALGDLVLMLIIGVI